MIISVIYCYLIYLFFKKFISKIDIIKDAISNMRNKYRKIFST